MSVVLKSEILRVEPPEDIGILADEIVALAKESLHADRAETVMEMYEQSGSLEDRITNFAQQLQKLLGGYDLFSRPNEDGEDKSS